MNRLIILQDIIDHFESINAGILKIVKPQDELMQNEIQFEVGSDSVIDETFDNSGRLVSTQNEGDIEIRAFGAPILDRVIMNLIYNNTPDFLTGEQTRCYVNNISHERDAAGTRANVLITASLVSRWRNFYNQI